MSLTILPIQRPSSDEAHGQVFELLHAVDDQEFILRGVKLALLHIDRLAGQSRFSQTGADIFGDL